MDKELFIAKKEIVRLQKKVERLESNIRHGVELFNKKEHIPLCHIDDVPKDLRLFSVTAAAQAIGMYPGKLFRLLAKHGIMWRENGMWRVEESLQDATFVLYTIGEQHQYGTLKLKLTLEGVKAIDKLIRQGEALEKKPKE